MVSTIRRWAAARNFHFSLAQRRHGPGSAFPKTASRLAGIPVHSMEHSGPVANDTKKVMDGPITPVVTFHVNRGHPAPRIRARRHPGLLPAVTCGLSPVTSLPSMVILSPPRRTSRWNIPALPERNSATRHCSLCVSLQLPFLPQQAQLPAPLRCAGNKGLITALESSLPGNKATSYVESTSYKNDGGPANRSFSVGGLPAVALA